MPTPPIAPSAAQATLVTATEIDLAWQDNSNNEDGFYLFRETGLNGFTLIATLPPNTTSYNDRGLMPSTQYDYQIQAFNLAGSSGFASVSATTSPSTVPAAPTSLMATGGYGQVALTWATSSGAVSYNLYRGTTPGGEGAIPVQSGLTTASFTDKGLGQSATYYYEVTAVGSGGESAPSSEVRVTTAGPALDLSGGFAGSTSLLTLNGSAKLNGNVLQLTDGHAGEAASAFYDRPWGRSSRPSLASSSSTRMPTASPSRYRGSRLPR